MAAFTVKPLSWQPYLEPLAMEDATPIQLEAMQFTPSGGKVSPYVRTLAHDPESYAARTTLYNQIMYDDGGLSNEWRELGALVASAVNKCVYCASVHARRYERLSGRNDVVKLMYTVGLDADYEPKIRAVVDFCRALSVTPAQATPDHVQALVEQGFSTADISDLIHATAIFGWANRLMHILGHAVPAGTATR
ncbi:putative peroxidase-related enzyme [Ketogulonicigenium robustum]|uniref:Putative peroxidase-related enzyme n=1 Tax=Ketogulonicigenium robustum TaxID=92947 RepID=A0A1W6P1S5_9RHOB|nr:peroxidase-related enzyme [Ketogulonicigenium robustum]ARO15247.1 putative peroxidase-related enzyme [Ketogulonicigenium robustum]